MTLTALQRIAISAALNGYTPFRGPAYVPAEIWAQHPALKRANRSKYEPHQGRRECARRRRQLGISEG